MKWAGLAFFAGVVVLVVALATATTFLVAFVGFVLMLGCRPVVRAQPPQARPGRHAAAVAVACGPAGSASTSAPPASACATASAATSSRPAQSLDDRSVRPERDAGRAASSAARWSAALRRSAGERGGRRVGTRRCGSSRPRRARRPLVRRGQLRLDGLARATRPGSPTSSAGSASDHAGCRASDASSQVRVGRRAEHAAPPVPRTRGASRSRTAASIRLRARRPRSSRPRPGRPDSAGVTARARRPAPSQRGSASADEQHSRRPAISSTSTTSTNGLSTARGCVARGRAVAGVDVELARGRAWAACPASTGWARRSGIVVAEPARR